jgi:hypothetical protein
MGHHVKSLGAPIAALLTLLAGNLPLAAQALSHSPSNMQPEIMAEALQVMCNPSGAGAWRFGETGVPYSSRLENSLGMRVKLTPHMAPFDQARPLATPWSGRLAQVQYSAELAQDADASAALKALVAAAERAGWTRSAEMEDAGRLPIYLLPLAGDLVYELPGDAKVVASLGRLGKQVTLSCGHKDLLQANAREALGELPPGTPRPQALPLQLMNAASPADCERPEVQREMLTVMDGRANELMSQMLRRISHDERLIEWKRWKLESSGKVGKARMLEIMAGALEAGSPGGDALAGFALFPDLLATLERLTGQAQSGDASGACRSSFDMVGILRKMEAVSSRQWAAMDAALEAEAQKVGVSLG